MEEKERVIEKYENLLQEAKEDLQTPGKRHKQIPNILTGLRLLAPILIIPSALTGNFLLTGALAAGFALTDLADGFIARKFNLQSELGAALDALTDKVFVGTLLLASSVANPFLLVNLALELAIARINVKEELKGNKPASTKVGKAKTWAVFGLAAAGIIAPALSISAALPVLSAVTALMQGATIYSYLDKYKESAESTQVKLPEEKETPSIEEEAAGDKQAALTYAHTYQDKASTSKEEVPKTPEEIVAELESMREFLVKEQQNKTNGGSATDVEPFQKKL